MDSILPKQPLKFRIKYVFAWGIPAAVILALAVYFGPQTIIYCKLRPAILRPSDEPPRGWSSIPWPLADTAASLAEGTTISYYGYTFEVPWQEIARQRDEGRTVEVLFKTGQVIKFNNPKYFDWEPINSFSGQVDQESFREAFGLSTKQTKFQQFEAVTSAAPSQLSPFRSHRNFARIRTLIEIKGLWFEHSTAASDIFSFQTKDYRGFEYSGLLRDWQNVVLNLFDRADRHWFTILMATDAGSGVKLTQAEINRVIHTFREAPPSQSNSSLK